jgi:hypothetical protein
VTTSAEDGTFHLPGIPAGTVDITPEAGFGFVPESVTVQVPTADWVEFSAPSLVAADGVQLFSTANLMRAGEWEARQDVTSTAAGGVYGLNVFLSSSIDLSGARVSLDFDTGSLARSYVGTRATQFLALDPSWRATPVSPGRFVKRVPLVWQAADASPQTIEVPFLVYDTADRLVGADTLRWDLEREDDVAPIIYPRIEVAGRGLVLPGREIIIRGDVLDGSALARVGARLIDRDSGNFISYVTLYDDGVSARHGDVLAGDRLYSTVFSTRVEADMRVDLEAEDASGNTVVQTGAWHISSRPFEPEHRYLLLTWSQPETGTDAHRAALQEAGIDHDYWEFDVRGQFPDTLLADYEGIVWSWHDRLLDRAEDRSLFQAALYANVPIALLGIRIDPDNWLDPLTGITRTGSVWIDRAEGASEDSVFAGTSTDVTPGLVPTWQGGSGALLFDGHVIGARSGSTMITGLSPLLLPESSRADYLRKTLYAITGDTRLSTPATSSDSASPSATFDLNRPYPNPASTESLIGFSLDSPGPVRLDAYDVLGRKVATLLNEYLVAGEHRKTWELAELPAGVYFVTLTAGGMNATTRLLVTRE